MINELLHKNVCITILLFVIITYIMLLVNNKKYHLFINIRKNMHFYRYHTREFRTVAFLSFFTSEGFEPKNLTKALLK